MNSKKSKNDSPAVNEVQNEIEDFAVELIYDKSNDHTPTNLNNSIY